MKDGKGDGDGYALEEVVGVARGEPNGMEEGGVDVEKGDHHATLRDDFERREALASWPMPIESNAK